MLGKLRFRLGMTLAVCGLCAVLAFSATANAEEVGTEAANAEVTKPEESRSWMQSIGDSFSLAWNEGKLDLYLPLVAWHNTAMYDSTSEYNERPWGFGIGMSAFDSDGDQHGLFAMGIMDSKYHFQPIVGYSYIANWELFKDFSVGAGVAAGITARDNYKYIPFPAALPVVSLQYSNIALQATYIPGTYNNGNALFAWLRWHFD